MVVARSTPHGAHNYHADGFGRSGEPVSSTKNPQPRFARCVVVKEASWVGKVYWHAHDKTVVLSGV